MKVSVILSTYNGEKYIIEQMDSIKNQSKPADEVIICDDCSKDKTYKIIQDYIKINSLDNWHLYRNEKTKGFIKNFLDGSKLATGDLLFYSDQDDVWHEEKIEHMYKTVKENDALATYCLTSTIDSKGKYRKNQIDKINRIPSKETIKQVSLYEKIKYARSPGLCLAFKKEILEEVCRISMQYGLPHDIPVGTVAAVKGRYYVINEELVAHRVHFNNVSTPDTKIKNSYKNLDKQVVSRTMKLKELLAINDIYREDLSVEETQVLDIAIKTTDNIIKCLENRKIGGLCRAILLQNEMMNQGLAVRNLLAVIGCKFKGVKQ